MNGGKHIGGALVAVVLLGGGLGYKFYNKGQVREGAHDAMHSVITRADGYEQNAAYYDEIFERAHERAFDESFRLGGRRASSFNDERYVDTVFAVMIQEAREDQSIEVVRSLENLRAGGH